MRLFSDFRGRWGGGGGLYREKWESNWYVVLERFFFYVFVIKISKNNC